MLKAQRETLSLIVILLMELLIGTEAMPVDLQDAMKRATSLETFMQMLNASVVPSVEPENPGGSALIIANEACKPIEMMVPVPQPRKRRALTFPVYVKLFRCSGGCDIEPRLSHCVATETTKIPIKVGVVSWRKGDNSISEMKKKVSEKVLVNETRCGCACKRVKRGCNSKTHFWNDRTCRCECLSAKETCHTPYVWNKYSCSCACPKTTRVCHGPGKIWDPEQCRCVCFEEKCSKGYYRNPETCRCTCHRNWCPNTHDRIFKMTRFRDPSTIELAKPKNGL